MNNKLKYKILNKLLKILNLRIIKILMNKNKKLI